MCRPVREFFEKHGVKKLKIVCFIHTFLPFQYFFSASHPKLIFKSFFIVHVDPKNAPRSYTPSLVRFNGFETRVGILEGS